MWPKASYTRTLILLIPFFLLGCGRRPEPLIEFALTTTPNTPVPGLNTPTETQIPPSPMPTSTNTPISTDAATLTPTPLPATFTPSPTSTPTPGGFEVSTEGWGEALKNRRPEPGKGVSRNCNIAHTGSCSLEFQPSQIIDGDAFVARFATVEDSNTLITAWVYVPSDVCSESACSTAKLIVQDKGYKSHEGDFVELNSPEVWIQVTIDLRDKSFPTPYQTIGVHFYLITEYRGPLYIDTITLTKH